MPRIVLLCALLLAACGKAEPEAADVLTVRVAQVLPGNASGQVEAAGTVQLRRATLMGFTTGGRIATITVDEGDRVRRGQLVAALESTPVSAGLATAQAERRRADAELQRMATLHAKGWVTKARLDDARAAAESAAASVSSTRFQVDTSRLYAPGDGIVLARAAEPGQVVVAGAAVVEVGDERGGYVLRAPLPDRVAAGVRAGQPANVSIPVLSRSPVAGSVVEIAGRADQRTGTFMAEVAIPALPGLRAGQIGTVRFASTQAAGNGVAVPPAAVFAPRGGEALVYVARPGDAKVALRRVLVAETSDGSIAVESGLRAGEWVVVSALDRLQPGQTVRAVARGR